MLAAIKSASAFSCRQDKNSIYALYTNTSCEGSAAQAYLGIVVLIDGDFRGGRRHEVAHEPGGAKGERVHVF